MSMRESIKKFLTEEEFQPTSRSDKLLAEAYAEALEQDRLFDFLKWMTDQSDGKAGPRTDDNVGKVSLSAALASKFTSTGPN